MCLASMCEECPGVIRNCVFTTLKEGLDSTEQGRGMAGDEQGGEEDNFYSC